VTARPASRPGAQPATRDRIAAIDVGSNSVRLLVAEYDPASGLEIIDELKDQPRLAAGLAKTGCLDDASIERAMQALSRMREVCLRDDKVDALHRSVFRILLTHMMEDPHMIGAGMELFLVSRNLERVADLATNIGEDVVFLVEGKSIKHHAEDRGDAPASGVYQATSGS
jgi:hypothetical protein